jgi:hypothetical protein
VVLLGSCSVYHKIFHPYRIPNPKLSAEQKAQMRAAKKAKKKGFSLGGKKKAAEPVTDVMASEGAAAPLGEPAATAEKPATELAKKSSVKYDKKGRLKNKVKLKSRSKQPKPSFFDKLSHLFTRKSHGNVNPKGQSKPRKKAKFGSPAPDAPDAP